MKWQVDEDKPWFKEAWPNYCPKNIQFKEISCGDFFEKQRIEHSSEVFMSFLNTKMTYFEAGEYIDALATSFYRLGMRKGYVLALLMPNSFQYILSFYACMKIGVIVVPINPNLKKVQILKILKLTQPTTIITSTDLWKSVLRPLIPQIKLDFLIYTSILDFVDNKRAVQREYGKVPHSRVDFPDAIRLLDLSKSLIQLPNVPISPKSDIAVYISTAGSTREPRLCELSHFNLISNATQCVSWFGDNSTGIGNLGVIPLYNPFGMTCVMNITIGLGGWMILFPKIPSAEHLLIEIHNTNNPKGLILFGSDLVFKGIIESISQNDYLNIKNKVKYGIMTCSPLYPDIKKVFQNSMGGKLIESYGLTEASPIISIGNLVSEKMETYIGLPLPGTNLAIFDSINFDLGPKDKFGEEYIGEICVSGPQIMRGYFGSHEATQEVLKKFNDKTWLQTGDLGYINEEGTIILTERKHKKKKKIENVPSYLVDVEKFVLKLKSVNDVAVLGLPPGENETGRITKMWITLNSEYIGTVSPKEFSEWIEKEMPEYKMDTDVEIVTPGPKPVLGKLQKQPIKMGKLQSAKKYL